MRIATRRPRCNMPTDAGKIIWTEIDEAPALATYSLLPIIRKYTGGTGIALQTAEISLARRNLPNFPPNPTPAQPGPDRPTQPGGLAKPPRPNTIKPPQKR